MSETKRRKPLDKTNKKQQREGLKIEVGVTNLSDPRFGPVERLEYQILGIKSNSKIYPFMILLQDDEYIVRVDGIGYFKDESNKLTRILSPNANLELTRTDCQAVLSKSRSMIKGMIKEKIFQAEQLNPKSNTNERNNH
jgi:hypothetical protein